MTVEKIGLGGGCHWCTEAVFQMLKGVKKVEQGFIASVGENSVFSEAVIVHFNPEKISLKRLLLVHLKTHSSTSNHNMREKYRSAVYTFSSEQEKLAMEILSELQKNFSHRLITKVYPFSDFRHSPEMYRNYFQKGRKKPFCKRFIDPKLRYLLKEFYGDVKEE